MSNENQFYGYRDEAELMRLNPEKRDKCICGHERGEHYHSRFTTKNCAVKDCPCAGFKKEATC